MPKIIRHLLTRNFRGDPQADNLMHRQAARPQAALLAAVLPNPRRMSAAYPSEYVRQRAAEIDASVRGLGGPGYLAEL